MPATLSHNGNAFRSVIDDLEGTTQFKISLPRIQVIKVNDTEIDNRLLYRECGCLRLLLSGFQRFGRGIGKTLYIISTMVSHIA